MSLTVLFKTRIMNPQSQIILRESTSRLLIEKKITSLFIYSNFVFTVQTFGFSVKFLYDY